MLTINKIYGIFTGLIKLTGGAVKTGLGVVADTATLGGVLTDKDEPYTSSGLKKIKDSLEDIFD